jgi:hypothetical protein
MDLHDDIVLDGVWIGNLREGKPTDAGIVVSNGNGFHHTVSLGGFVIPFSRGNRQSRPTRQVARNARQ